MIRTALVVGSLALGACVGQTSRPAPSPSSEFESEVRLGALLPSGAQLVGVAVSPEGKTYVLDRRTGLYEIDPSSTSAKRVFDASDLARYGVSPGLELTDVAALGNERFALTAENDGYMLDLHGGTFTSYFCYLPAIQPPPSPSGPPQVVSVSNQYRSAGIRVKQRTESVAFSPGSLRLFAQPQTIRMDTGEVVGSELFVFPESGGEPMQVTPIFDTTFLAGGMLAVDDQSLLLGVRDRLYGTTQAGAPALLRAFGEPVQIAGMARAKSGNLLLLDAAGQRLLELSGY